MSGAIEKADQFPKTRSGWAQRWSSEFQVAQKPFKEFHTKGDKVVDRFLDKRTGMDSSGREQKLNLFHANIKTLQSMLYGRMPKIEVDRSHQDQNDDVARVAAETLQRLLNNDLEPDGGDYTATLRNALEDRLLPGLGSARLKYCAEYEEVEVPAITGPDGVERAPAVTQKNVKEEWVETIYTHWKDQLWSPARTYSELRWKAFRTYMTRDELVERFPEVGDKIPLKGRDEANKGENKGLADAWQSAEVWEIWDKESKQVFYYVDGYDEILEDATPDPLNVSGFWPDPPAMIANPTTNNWMPTSDFYIAQDLYNAIDTLMTRISVLTDACKLIGVYDKSNAAIPSMLIDGYENQLIPVDSWAVFAEKGGLEGTIQWLPLEAVVEAINILTQKLSEKMQQLYEVTGMADILRGAGDPRASATQDKLKSQYASIRVQALQDEFARFASDLQRMKAEIICKVFQTESIVKYSNMQTSPDWEQYGMQAMELLKDPDNWKWRIVVRPESLAMIDYAQLKQDRQEFMEGLGFFMQSSAPLVEMDKRVLPFLLQMLQWGMAGFKGSNQIEGVIDQAIATVKQAPPEAEKDPAVEKAQMDMQLKQQESQQKMQLQREQHQQKMEQSQQEFNLKMMEMMQEFRLKQQEMQMDMKKTLMEFTMQMQENRANLQNRQSELEMSRQEREQEHEFDVKERKLEHDSRKKQIALESKNRTDGGRDK